jgi:hypothetical protein
VLLHKKTRVQKTNGRPTNIGDPELRALIILAGHGDADLVSKLPANGHGDVSHEATTHAKDGCKANTMIVPGNLELGRFSIRRGRLDPDLSRNIHITHGITAG